jgi:two-component system cell cycle response regulator
VTETRLPEPSLPALRILIADDDPLTCRMLESKLRERGYPTTVAMDGNEAWHALQSADAPRIAILDWMMPGASGVEICRRLRSANAPRYTYVLLATARTAPGDLIAGFEAGADDYITKPVRFWELLARLRTGVRVIELEQRLLGVQAELEVRATRDVLTGAWNRRAICEMLERELNRAQRQRVELSIALIDIDHFKSINDRFGHAGGDAVLCEVANRLQAALRPYDAVGRYGGEEFLVIEPSCTLEHAGRVAERLRHSLSDKPIQVGEIAIEVTACIGVATLAPAQPVSGDELIRIADAALYEAKRSGRNRVVAAASSAT